MAADPDTAVTPAPASYCAAISAEVTTTVTGMGRTEGDSITTGLVIVVRGTDADMDTTVIVAIAGTMVITIVGGTIQTDSGVAIAGGTIATEAIAGMMVIGIVDSIIWGDRSADAAGGTTAMQTEMANRAGMTGIEIIVRQVGGPTPGNRG